MIKHRLSMDLESRRSFLKGVGVLSGTAFAGSTFVSSQAAEAAARKQAKAWPWPYATLDPQRSAELGHQGFYEGACCYGTFKGIVGQLVELYGSPYDTFPMDMMRYGEGGVTGWGSVCGTINGAAAAINLVTPFEVAKKLINEIVAWYSSTELPIYVPPGSEAMPANASDSPLCHASVTKWCEVSHAGATSADRKERCARLCADVASKTATLLNENLNGTFVSQYGPAQTVSECMTCHGPNVMDNTLGKMDCVSCHQPHSTLPFARDWWKSSGGCDLVPDGQVDERDLLRFLELMPK